VQRHVHAVLTLAALAIAVDAAAQIRPVVVASGFTAPLAFIQDPTDRTVQFVVQQNGHIRVLKSGAVQPADFLDVSSVIAFGGEQGLLGLAFPPDAAASRRLFVNFTNTAGHTVVARFKRSANPLVVDPSTRFDLRWASEHVLFTIAQPFANHNGGNLAFGPDGYLYVGMGDGGSGNDPGNRAQTPGELLGKMLRVDVNVADSDPIGYAIPPSNPWTTGAGGTRPEIWAFGLRNPWRWSFDDRGHGGTGALVIGDVGQNAYEEIDYEPAGRGGRNYGWRYREGLHDNVTTLPPAYLPLTDPIFEYDHSQGVSITGGYVYRGSELSPGFSGRYFFADLTGRVWSIALAIDGAGEAHASGLLEHTAQLGGTAQLGNISSFGVDADAELYVVSYSLGKVIKIGGVPRPPTNLRIIPMQ